MNKNYVTMQALNYALGQAADAIPVIYRQADEDYFIHAEQVKDLISIIKDFAANMTAEELKECYWYDEADMERILNVEKEDGYTGHYLSCKHAGTEKCHECGAYDTCYVDQE